MAERVREDLQGDRLHWCTKAVICHFPLSARYGVLVGRHAVVDADSWRGDHLDFLQDQILGEVFSRLGDTREGSWIPHFPAGEPDYASIHTQVWVSSSVLFTCNHWGVEVQEVWGRVETWAVPVYSSTPHQGVSYLGGAGQGGGAARDGTQWDSTIEDHDRPLSVEETIH